MYGAAPCQRRTDAEKGAQKMNGQPTLKIAFLWQPVPEELVVLTDSDWAGCKVTRRSTSGIVVKLGGHLLHFSSKLQKNIASSSGEAELSAQVGGLTDALGIKNLFSRRRPRMTLGGMRLRSSGFPSQSKNGCFGTCSWAW